MQRTNEALTSHSFSGQQTCMHNLLKDKVLYCTFTLGGEEGWLVPDLETTAKRDSGSTFERVSQWRAGTCQVVLDLTHDGIWSTYAIPPIACFSPLTV